MIIHPHKTTLVVVHLNGCGPCESFIHPQKGQSKSDWGNVVDLLDKTVDAFKVESQEYDAFKQQNSNVDLPSIEGYPTIFKVQNGKVSVYEGERLPQKIAEWTMGRTIRGGKRRTVARRRRTRGGCGCSKSKKWFGGRKTRRTR